MKFRHNLIRVSLLSLIFLLILGTPVLAAEVLEFELEIELVNHEEYEIEYEVKGDQYKAEYQEPGSAKIYGEEAKAKIDPLLAQLQLQPDMNVDELQREILTYFSIDESQIDEFELEVEFSNGQEIKIKRS